MAAARNSPLSFRYELSYEEAYEAFYLLSFRRSRPFKLAVGCALVAVVVILLILFVMDPRKIHYFMLVILALLLLFYMIYMPVLKARRGAKQVARQKGTYQVTVGEDGVLALQQEQVPLAGDRNARAYETERIFAIRTNTTRTFCLPKRLMTQTQIERVRQILAAHTKLLQR